MTENIVVLSDNPADLLFPEDFARAVASALPHRHKWVHLKDVVKTKRNNRRKSISFTAKGEYSCECGAIKLGPPVGGL